MLLTRRRDRSRHDTLRCLRRRQQVKAVSSSSDSCGIRSLVRVMTLLCLMFHSVDGFAAIRKASREYSFSTLSRSTRPPMRSFIEFDTSHLQPRQSLLTVSSTNSDELNDEDNQSPEITDIPDSSSSSSSSDSSNKESQMKTNRMDDILAKLTSGFPFFVLGTAILALIRPSLLQWTNRGDIITIMLSAVMWGTGLTLTKDDFTVVLQKDLIAVPVGILCQFLIMPFSAYLIGNTILWRAFTPAAGAATKATHELGKAAFLGLCLVGCSPGGTASNLVSLIAKADVALSVLLTSCSTLLASIATPLLVKFLVGSTIAVSGWTLCTATARVVLLPVLFGMIVNAKAPNLSTSISRFTPFCSVVLVALICGGVVAENASLLRVTDTLSAGASSSPPNLLPFLVASVLGLHCLGFLVGYLVPRFGLRFSERTSRTISIETGMQNSALAVVLARSIGAPAIASLPGAMSATAHSCLGSILAAFWRGRDAATSARDNEISNSDGKESSPSESIGENPDDYPELLI